MEPMAVGADDAGVPVIGSGSFTDVGVSPGGGVMDIAGRYISGQTLWLRFVVGISPHRGAFLYDFCKSVDFHTAQADGRSLLFSRFNGIFSEGAKLLSEHSAQARSTRQLIASGGRVKAHMRARIGSAGCPRTRRRWCRHF